ncbi:MAG: hypothetical protein P8075_19625 [Deltaproteobacteria bacterium]|jgi:hypothetical protein
MVSKFKQKTVVFLFWAAALTYLITSCVSVGSVNLSSKNGEKIIPGKTTKDEISEVLGEPEQILRLDKEGLENYLSRVAVSSSPPFGFGEDLYEVWIYNRWSYGAGLVFTPGYEEAEICIVVVNGKGVCAERFYRRKSSFRF